MLTTYHVRLRPNRHQSTCNGADNRSNRVPLWVENEALIIVGRNYDKNELRAIFFMHIVNGH